MDLSSIIAISGKPGLYLIVAQSPNSIIVENLENGRRMPAFATNKISALEDITMYSTEDDVPLTQIMKSIWDKESGGQCISHKATAEELRTYLSEVFPEGDQEQIYDSDIRKLFQWYNVMQANGILAERAEMEAGEESEAEDAGEETQEEAAAVEESADSSGDDTAGEEEAAKE